MKRFLLLAAFLFLSAIPLYGQGVVSPAEVALSTVNGTTRPIANATITVCAANASGIPCATPITVYTNSTLSTAFANQSDSNGNYQFFALPGTYTVTVTSSLVPGFTGFSYQVTLAQVTAAGTITMAGGTGSHTFTTAYTVTPVCTATDTTATNAVKVTPSTTSITVTGTGTDVIAWHCTNSAN